MAGGGDIIIKGGSVDLIFDERLYPKASNDPSSYTNPDRKITRVLITGDISFDSGEKPEGWLCDIRVTTTLPTAK